MEFVKNRGKYSPVRTFKIDYLINWYYGNLAYRFENCGVDIYHRIRAIASRLHVLELTHREFVMLMKENLGFRSEPAQEPSLASACS